MRSMCRLGLLWSAAALVVTAPPVYAQDSLPGPGSASAAHAVVHQQLVLLLNPMGAEHELRVGVARALGDPTSLWFSGAHVEAGAVSYLSPVYAIQGGYLQVRPLSFLQLRVEFTGTVLWPIPLNGAGYFGLRSDEVDLRADPLLAENAGSATGWTVRVSPRLMGRVSLTDEVRLVAADELHVQHDTLGDATHYYSQKHDLIAARRDWIVTNDGALLLEIVPEPDLYVRVGAFSNLRVVPRSGYVGHQLGPIVGLELARPADDIANIEIFVRGGYYTHHIVRADELTILAGVAVNYAFVR